MPSFVSAPLAFVVASAAALVLYIYSGVRFPVADELPTTYRAYEYTSYGAVREQLQLVDNIPLASKISTTDVRIKVVSAALNPIDYKLVASGFNFFPVGPTADAPFRIGFDAAGVVVDVGARVTTFQPGDFVFAATPFNRFGTCAQFVTLDTQFVVRKPANLSFDAAASVPFAATTSYQALVTHGNVKAGDRVLILGGSGGTGMFAIQIAKALGAHVITTTSFRNTEFVKSLGADEVIDYTTTKWVDAIAPHSIDVVYDCGMEATAWNTDAQRVLTPNGKGRFVTLLDVPAPIASPINATLKRIVVKPNGRDLYAIAQLIERKQLTTHVHAVHPFGHAVQALEQLKAGHVRGKVVLHVSSPPHDTN